MLRTPLFDAKDPVTDKPFGDLPEWDLTDLYPAPDAPELTRDVEALRDQAASFAADYQGKLADLTPAQMLEAIQRYEAIDILGGRIMSYVGLRYYQQTTEPARAKMLGDYQSKITDLTTPLVFFSLEFNRIPDATYEAVFTLSLIHI